MSDREWLDSLKPGDEVLIPSGFAREASILTVKRRTPTQIVIHEPHRVDAERKFRASDAFEVGVADGWGKAHIAPVTEKAREEIWRRNAVNSLARAPWHLYSTDALRQAVAIVDSERVRLSVESAAKEERG